MRRRFFAAVAALAVALAVPLTTTTQASAASTEAELAELCEDLYASTFGVPNTEPLGVCQWDMALINAGTQSYRHATGDGVSVGVIDSGVALDHPDIAPNLDLDRSCSFIFDDTPTADPAEVANGDCSNKGAVEDLSGHGTHVASTIAAPVNDVGIAGVAPEATIVALKACTKVGYCFAESVAGALRYAGRQGIDVVNLSLFADPYLFYCKNEASQRRILQQLRRAARFATRNGVTIVASAGNEQADLQHPEVDTVSPDWPEGTNIDREIGNQCVVAPAEFPETLTVSATGPIGISGYDRWLAEYSSVGMSRVDVTAPGGDYFSATGTVQDAIIGAGAFDSDIWGDFDPLGATFLGITALSDGAPYVYLNGTSMSSPHAAGVAALVVEKHPRWSPKAVQAAVKRTASRLSCPPGWEALGDSDQRTRCYGKRGRTSFFGTGMVDALAASRS